jgi:hypothetical protein
LDQANAEAAFMTGARGGGIDPAGPDFEANVSNGEDLAENRRLLIRPMRPGCRPICFESHIKSNECPALATILKL